MDKGRERSYCLSYVCVVGRRFYGGVICVETTVGVRCVCADLDASVWVDDLVVYVRSNLWTNVRRKDLLVSPTCFEK